VVLIWDGGDADNPQSALCLLKRLVLNRFLICFYYLGGLNMISVIIPAYNEEGNVAVLFEGEE